MALSRRNQRGGPFLRSNGYQNLCPPSHPFPVRMVWVSDCSIFYPLIRRPKMDSNVLLLSRSEMLGFRVVVLTCVLLSYLRSPARAWGPLAVRWAAGTGGGSWFSGSSGVAFIRRRACVFVFNSLQLDFRGVSQEAFFFFSTKDDADRGVVLPYLGLYLMSVYDIGIRFVFFDSDWLASQKRHSHHVYCLLSCLKGRSSVKQASWCDPPTFRQRRYSYFSPCQSVALFITIFSSF